ncbi:putative RNA-directed DNA polymerase, eukaryota, reverse transcriptase zinc-binding domain protein, partial [Tanacetum coccineum]
MKTASVRSGYHQKDRKPSQNDKTEHGMEKTGAKSRPKSKNVQSPESKQKISSQTVAGTENTLDAILTHRDGPRKAQFEAIKVFVQGSGSTIAGMNSCSEDAPVKNSFQVLDDQVMKDKEECVLETMEEEYNKWSLTQMNFFYNNYHWYGLDPSYEDDDVAIEDGDMAKEIRAEDVDLDARSYDIGGDPNVDNVSNWVSNNVSCSDGMGIIVGWDPNTVRVMVISQSAQVMNLFVESINGHHRFYCSFVYAHVRASGRKPLWRKLICHSLVVKDEPWLLMGDFNVILDPSERLAGSSYFTSGMEDFRDSLGEMGVEDLCMFGLKFTWNTSPGKTDGLLKKLDKVMCNGAFVEKFVNSNALFLPFVASDHTPAAVEIPIISRAKPRPFKFANFLADKEEFLPIKPLRKLKFAQGDLAKKVVESRHELERVQAMMVDDSHNFVLRNKEIECLKVYKDAMRDEESMVKQRAKVSWLSEGDANTKFFHKTVKGKLNRNRIENVEDMDGLMFYGQHVGDQFMKHFRSVLGKARRVEPIFEPGSLFNKRLSPEVAEFMVRPVSREEIKSVFFAMNDDKAPRPDGFSSKFFKASWFVIGDEVYTAIGDFFKNGRLLKEVNATIIVLVPKSQTPQKVSDFRPILCRNVLYKAITKIIADRIKGFLGMLVDECQNAFIPSRQISDNVLLTQELMRNYHRNRGPSKVAFKIDIHKAYDSMEWDFMKQCMRGLRQGDSLSPYLFTLVMEVFSLMVKRKIEDDGGFKYHWRCDRLKLTHLSFVDDLMVFSRPNVHSMTILSKALIEFSGVFGLVPNLDKSSVFFGNVSEHVKVAILNVLPFAIGNLPVSSIQVYWASTFILPKAVNAEIEQLMRGFLWSHGELRRGHAKDIPVLNDSSWGWRKLLQCRDVLREHFICRIGDGSQTSVWYDNWLSLGPLSKFISNRVIYEAGFSLDCKVCDVVFNGEWLWPEGWRDKFPFLFHLPPPILFKDRRGRVLWRSNDGKVGNFSVSAVWSDLSESKPKVPWFKLFWFSQNIPRHAFMLRLAINQKLKTQDRIKVWQGYNDVKCSLCAVHDHLFFDCCFSLEIWHQFRDLVKLDSAPNALSVLIPYIAGRPINISVWIILQRLVIGALVYIVWQERNLRRFQMKCRSVKDVCMIIKDVVRFRLLSLKIRSSRQVTEAAELWNLGVEDGNRGRKFGFCMNG